MAYPENIDQFTEKLNKQDAVYVIEEEVAPSNGVYQAPLKHDNIIDSSVRVYTGKKLTGTKIENVILSIPENMEWKRIIKIFSNEPMLFITYETFGDQVEAEDINQLQQSMTFTQNEVDQYKTATDHTLSGHTDDIHDLANEKAAQTYVDTEMLKKADKETTYTKTETDNRIQLVVNAAPEALDTLQEIAQALNNDPDFAATITNELSNKVSKVEGKQLSAEDYTSEEKLKLAGIENQANNYLHPSSHPATMIVEDSSKRFVSDTEKATWNAKETTDGAQTKANDAESQAKEHSNTIVGVLANLTTTVKTNIVLAVNEIKAAIDTHKGATDNPHNVTKSHIGLGNVDDIQQASKTEFASHLSDNTRHITSTERSTWNDANSKKHQHINKTLLDKLTQSGTEGSFNLSEFVTQNELGNAGYGDMLKATYDTDNDGIVDEAQNADTLDGKHASAFETPTGAQNKVDNHANKTDNPHNVTSEQLHSLGDYLFAVSDPITNYPKGISTTFVRPDDGWPSYGTITTFRERDSGSSYQIYTPYSPTHGETFKMRYWIYSSDIWSSFFTLATMDDLNTKLDKTNITWDDLKGV